MNAQAKAFPGIGIETDLVGDGSGKKFPHTYSYEDAPGLTKRELFAAMAMQGLLRSDDTEIGVDELPRFAQDIARYSAAYADALLAELAK